MNIYMRLLCTSLWRE